MSQRPRPILIIGDAPDFHGGLSRVTRDIAGQLARSPLWRVATLGRGATTSRHLPFLQYAMRSLTGNEFGAMDIQRVWNDFAGKERGVVFTIYDPTRCLWLSRPEFCGYPELEAWLREDHFDLWGYITLDATGPQDKLSAMATDALLGYRRLLAYTKWGAGVIERSIGQARGLNWLPHGLDLKAWPLRDKDEAKSRLYPFLHEGQKLVGAVGTNQPRKDWGLMASVCQMLAAKDPQLKFWWHTDLPERFWSISALLHDFGLQNVTRVTYQLPQEGLSWHYTACDLTLHPGLGEGFGYPIFESLASGTPVLHGAYGGGYDVLLQTNHGNDVGMPQPVAYRLDGIHNQVRPVFDPADWASKAEIILNFDNLDRESVRASIAHLSWDGLWPLFSRWFEEGM